MGPRTRAAGRFALCLALAGWAACPPASFVEPPRTVGVLPRAAAADRLGGPGPAGAPTEPPRPLGGARPMSRSAAIGAALGLAAAVVSAAARAEDPGAVDVYSRSQRKRSEKRDQAVKDAMREESKQAEQLASLDAATQKAKKDMQEKAEAANKKKAEAAEREKAQKAKGKEEQAKKEAEQKAKEAEGGGPPLIPIALVGGAAAYVFVTGDKPKKEADTAPASGTKADSPRAEGTKAEGTKAEDKKADAATADGAKADAPPSEDAKAGTPADAPPEAKGSKGAKGAKD